MPTFGFYEPQNFLRLFRNFLAYEIDYCTTLSDLTNLSLALYYPTNSHKHENFRFATESVYRPQIAGEVPTSGFYEPQSLLGPIVTFSDY